jgi:hypothetical protein
MGQKLSYMEMVHQITNVHFVQKTLCWDLMAFRNGRGKCHNPGMACYEE